MIAFIDLLKNSVASILLMGFWLTKTIKAPVKQGLLMYMEARVGIEPA